MKHLLLLAFIGMATPLAAQHKTNEQAAAEIAALRTEGNFFYRTSENRNINISYSFTPARPGNTISLLLRTAFPQPLSLRITDKAGKAVAEWKPAGPGYLYRGTLDISTLKPGAYTYNIYFNKDIAHSIPFIKK